MICKPLYCEVIFALIKIEEKFYSVNNRGFCMLKYLKEISQKLEGLKSGMEKNIERWEKMPEDPEYVQKVINEINFKNNEIDRLQKTLSAKYSEARELKNQNQSLVNTMVKRAAGLHAESPEKLNEYGIINNK